MSTFEANPLDVLDAARDRLAAVSMIFFERTLLQLNEGESTGVYDILDEVRDDLEEIGPLLAVKSGPWARKERDEATNKTPPQRPDAEAAVVHQPEQTSMWPRPLSAMEVEIQIGRDIKLIRSLSYAANKLFTDELTNEGGGLELCENVWRFVEQIEAAARRAEDMIYTPRLGDAEFGPPERERAQSPKPRSPRPPSSGVNLTEDVPPEQQRDPDTSDAASRARA